MVNAYTDGTETRLGAHSNVCGYHIFSNSLEKLKVSEIDKNKCIGRVPGCQGLSQA
jgi:hypothetical protein